MSGGLLLLLLFLLLLLLLLLLFLFVARVCGDGAYGLDDLAEE